MATIRLIPSTYSLSDNTYMSVSNATNMYNNTDNTSYATITHSRNSTTTYYIYIKGFNFSDVPASATVNSFTVKLKAYESGLSTSTSYAPKLCNNTTTITSTCSAVSTSAKTLTFTGVSAAWSTIKGYGNNFGIRISVRRNSSYTKGSLYLYGAEILVDYSVPAEKEFYFKNNGVWTPAKKVYKKVNGIWQEVTDLTTIDKTKNYVKGN